MVWSGSEEHQRFGVSLGHLYRGGSRAQTATIDQLLTLNAENKEQERKCYQRWVTATEQRLLKAVCTKRTLFFFWSIGSR